MRPVVFHSEAMVKKQPKVFAGNHTGDDGKASYYNVLYTHSDDKGECEVTKRFMFDGCFKDGGLTDASILAILIDRIEHQTVISESEKLYANSLKAALEYLRMAETESSKED